MAIATIVPSDAPGFGPEEQGRIHLALCAPFPESEVKQRAGRAGMTYSYVTARAVMERLDEVVGPFNWSDDYAVVDASAKCVECTLTVLGVSRVDVGYPNAAGDAEDAGKEPMKAAYSDALKRAAVKFGIARYLYALPPTGRPAARPAQSREATTQTAASSGTMSPEKQQELVATTKALRDLRDPQSEWTIDVQNARNALSITTPSKQLNAAQGEALIQWLKTQIDIYRNTAAAPEPAPEAAPAGPLDF